MSVVPFRTKPSLQVVVQREPKLNSPCGPEQNEEPSGGDLRVGHLFAAMETEKEEFLGKDLKISHIN